MTYLESPSAEIARRESAAAEMESHFRLFLKEAGIPFEMQNAFDGKHHHLRFDTTPTLAQQRQFTRRLKNLARAFDIQVDDEPTSWSRLTPVGETVGYPRTAGIHTEHRLRHFDLGLTPAMYNGMLNAFQHDPQRFLDILYADLPPNIYTALGYERYQALEQFIAESGIPTMPESIELRRGKHDHSVTMRFSTDDVATAHKLMHVIEGQQRTKDLIGKAPHIGSHDFSTAVTMDLESMINFLDGKTKPSPSCEHNREFAANEDPKTSSYKVPDTIVAGRGPVLKMRRPWVDSAMNDPEPPGQVGR